MCLVQGCRFTTIRVVKWWSVTAKASKRDIANCLGLIFSIKALYSETALQYSSWILPHTTWVLLAKVVTQTLCCSNNIWAVVDKDKHDQTNEADIWLSEGESVNGCQPPDIVSLDKSPPSLLILTQACHAGWVPGQTLAKLATTPDWIDTLVLRGGIPTPTLPSKRMKYGLFWRLPDHIWPLRPLICYGNSKSRQVNWRAIATFVRMGIWNLEKKLSR